MPYIKRVCNDIICYVYNGKNDIVLLPWGSTALLEKMRRWRDLHLTRIGLRFRPIQTWRSIIQISFFAGNNLV